MKFAAKSLLAGAAIALLVGCSPSPTAQINQSCRASGETAEVCECFTKQLEQSLTPQQLTVVAASMAQGQQNASPEASAQMQQQLGINGAMAVMGAGKQCGLSGMQPPV
jgi:hypothetical protein